MIERVLDNVDSKLIDAEFILLILKEQQDEIDLSSQLRPLKTRMKFVIVNEVTEGAACTALLAKEHINCDIPLLIANSDQYILWDVDAYWSDRIQALKEGIDGDVLCFHVPIENNDKKWSYAAVGDDGYLVNLKEKEVISENATVGLYYWAKGSDFVESAELMIAADDRVNGEFYVAPAYNYGVQNDRKYTLSFCDKMYGLGVPHDLTTFLSDYARPKCLGIGGIAERDLRKYYGRTSGPMIFIAHRGNIDGPNPEDENKPAYLLRALSMGFDVELDAWFNPETGQWALGHDEPQYPVAYEFLLTPGFWVHAKNGITLQAIVRDPRIHCFFHDTDEYTITSRGYIWAYPDVNMAGTNCIAVSEFTIFFPAFASRGSFVLFIDTILLLLYHSNFVVFSHPERILDQDIGGICHDKVGALRDTYIARRKLDETVCSTSRTIRLVVFDLDGVLVESRDLHYEALNRALEEEAGAQYVISRDEHEHVYDGLSTNQKLQMLGVAKGLPRDLHKNVWTKKQEYTESLVKEVLLPSDNILNAITALKQMCLPVCVASNCIKSSVQTILTHVGLIQHVDVYLSNEDVDNAKPSPDIYQKACNIFGVDPSCTLVVEDSTKGFEAASRAGCHLLRVTNPNDVTASSVKSRIQELETLTEDVTVVLPLAGPYPEIWQARETPEMPIFLSDVGGESILEIVGKSLLSRRYITKYIFIVKESAANAFDIDSLCARAVNFAPLKIVKIKTDTLSSIHSILQVPAEFIAENTPLLVADGHHLPVWRQGQSLDDLLGSHSDASLTAFQSIDPRFSYVRLNTNSRFNSDIRSKQGPNSLIEVTMESRPSSNLACSGLYYFKQARYFLKAAEAVIQANQRWLGRFYTAQLFNKLVEDGLEAEALHLTNSWSLRNVNEVQNYERLALPALAVGRLDNIYDEMVERQSQDVAANGVTFDMHLIVSEIEPQPKRRCLAAYTLCDSSNWKPSVSYSSFMADVKDVLGEGHCYYESSKDQKDIGEVKLSNSGVLSGVLHWTFFQLIGFNYFDMVEIPESYHDVVESTLLRHLPRIKINFSRLVLTPSNIILLGFPTADVNSARFRLRRCLTRCGLPLFEPYMNDIVHMTLVRFASPVDESTLLELQRTILQYKSTLSFGSLSVDELKLSPATWKMQAQELQQYQPDQCRTIKLS